jgi:hypothetical protein
MKSNLIFLKKEEELNKNIPEFSVLTRAEEKFLMKKN